MRIDARGSLDDGIVDPRMKEDRVGRQTAWQAVEMDVLAQGRSFAAKPVEKVPIEMSRLRDFRDDDQARRGELPPPVLSSIGVSLARGPVRRPPALPTLSSGDLLRRLDDETPNQRRPAHGCRRCDITVNWTPGKRGSHGPGPCCCQPRRSSSRRMAGDACLTDSMAPASSAAAS